MPLIKTVTTDATYSVPNPIVIPSQVTHIANTVAINSVKVTIAKYFFFFFVANSLGKNSIGIGSR